MTAQQVTQYVVLNVNAHARWYTQVSFVPGTCTRFSIYLVAPRFSAAWIDTISVLLAKGRARVGVADAATDWPRRIRDMQYLDHESLEVGA